MLHEEVQRALAIDRSATLAERTIDITTTGRRTGQARRMEISFSCVDERIYITGKPRERARDWLVNLAADPHFVFHLKNGVTADLPAVATVVTDPDERRHVLTEVLEDYNGRRDADSQIAPDVLDEWVESSPMIRVDFLH